MSTGTTFDVIYLGTAPSIDNVEGDTFADGYANLVGGVFGSEADPLYDHVASFSPGSTGYGAGDPAHYDTNNSAANDTFRIDGGPDHVFDVVAAYHLTINYVDGSSDTALGVIVQDTAGNTYLMPHIDYNAHQAALEAGPIQSIGIGDLYSTNANLASVRYQSNFQDFIGDDVVDGTAGDDAIGMGYADAQDDRISNEGEVVDAGAGNDTIDAQGGDDTVYGGAGDDLIYASGTSGPEWQQVVSGDNFVGSGGQDFYSWAAATGSSATIRLNSSMGAEGQGDGVADYIRVETTNATGTLRIGDFDVGTDRIVLSEAYTGIATSSSAGVVTYTLTYANGNQQTFEIHHSAGSVTPADVFTTTMPDITFSDDDLLSGGDGADVFVIEDAFGNDTIVGGEGGTDNDAIDASLLSGPVDVSFSGNEAGTLSDGSDTLQFSEIERFTLSGHDDTLDASAASSPVWVDAGAGDDLVTGSAGADTIYGGQGNDTVIGGAGDDVIIGGTGNDVMTGGTGDDLFWMSAGDGVDRITDFDRNDDDGDGFYNDQLNVSELTGGSGPGGSVTNLDVVVSDDGFGNALLSFPGGEQLILQGIDPADMTGPAPLFAAGIPCFTAGARILTATGERRVQDLRQGDRILTGSGEALPILWLGETRVSAAAQQADPSLRAIVLRPGGAVALRRPIIVSRQHCFALSRGGGDGETGFARAAQLLRIDPAHVSAHAPTAALRYFHLLLPRHAVIFAEGAATESFYPGPRALAGLGAAQQRSLLQIMPELVAVMRSSPDIAAEVLRRVYGPPACVHLRQKDLNRWIRRGPLFGHTSGPVSDPAFDPMSVPLRGPEPELAYAGVFSQSSSAAPAPVECASITVPSAGPCN